MKKKPAKIVQKTARIWTVYEVPDFNKSGIVLKLAYTDVRQLPGGDFKAVSGTGLEFGCRTKFRFSEVFLTAEKAMTRFRLDQEEALVHAQRRIELVGKLRVEDAKRST